MVNVAQDEGEQKAGRRGEELDRHEDTKDTKSTKRRRAKGARSFVFVFFVTSWQIWSFSPAPGSLLIYRSAGARLAARGGAENAEPDLSSARSAAPRDKKRREETMRALTAALALSLSAALQVDGAGAETWGVATSSPGSIYHSAGSAIAKVAREKAGLNLVVQPFTSPNIHIPVVDGGEVEYGLSNVYELGLAVSGHEHFDGKPHKNLRAVFLMFPLRTAIFVKKDSRYRSIADLKGARMPDGFASQKILLPIIDAAYATAGLTRKDMVPVMTASVVRQADDFIAGKTEGFAFALGSAKVQEANAAVGGVRALPMPNTPEALAAIRKHLPQAYLRLEQPGPRNPGILEPMHIIAYDALVFANAKVSDEAVYKLAKAMYESKAELAQAFGPFALFDPAAMAKKIDPIAFHPGAIKFYKEKNQWPPKE